MRTLTDYCLSEFGEKLYRLSLSAGTTCPNRDGTLDTRGCIFCSCGGSGEFAEDGELSVAEQIDRAKRRVAGKFRGSRYIAYFQSYTATYGDARALEEKFLAAALRDDIAAVSAATRPDCLGKDILDMLSRVAEVKPVWVELGLQTAKEETARYIRRGYSLPVYDDAVERLNAHGFHTVTHVILGLPGETEEDMLQTVRHAVQAGTQGIKLQLLHVLRGTDLERDYLAGRFRCLRLDEYVDILRRCARLLPPDVVVHRLTGDGDKRILVAPLWSGDKKRVLNAINRGLGLAK